MMAYDQNFTTKLAEKKAKQLGYSEFVIQPKEYTISALETKAIAAHGEHYFIIEAPYGIAISSDNGEYNKENPAAKDHILGHSGAINITNHTNEDIVVKFIHLLLIKLK